MTTTVTSAAAWLPLRMDLPWAPVHLRRSHGVGTLGISPARAPSQIGMKKPTTAMLWATPRVTTVVMSRGAWAKRRMTSLSTSAPNSGPPIRAIGSTTR